MRQFILYSSVLLLLFPGVLALSFSSGPSVNYGAGNFTTSDDFFCQFTPSGSGSLSANITWFYNTTAWVFDDDTLSPTSGVSASSSVIASANSSKNQLWRCQVTLFNGTDTLVANSSGVLVQNTPPTINTLAQFVFYEDQEYSFFITALDEDGDNFLWTSSDLDRGLYANQELFIINSSGFVSIFETDEDLVGNHTMQITAFDEPTTGTTRLFELQLVAVNDVPIFDTNYLLYSCNESVACTGYIFATDQDNASSQLTYTFNESFINGSSNGTFYFTPSYAQALIQNWSVAVTVTDGLNTTSGLLNISIFTANHEPNVSWVNASGTQNDASFIFDINVTDVLDPLDVFNFSIDSSCSVANPWSISTITDGYNSTVAIGRVNTSLTSNDYVVCRNVTVTVYEFDNSTGNSRGTYYYAVSLNITNSNDPPVIHEINGDEVQSNMSNQSAALGLSFSYTVNASDPDELTYEGDTLTYSLTNVPTFDGSSPLFTVNSSTGQVTSVQSSMNSSYAGVHTFTVWANDSLSPSYGAQRNLTVSVTLNAAPSIDALNSSACYDNFTCEKYFSGNDPEGIILSLTLNSLNYTNPLGVSRTNYSASEISTLLGINVSSRTLSSNTTTFLLNFTADDVHRGSYVLNFTFTDVVGNTNSTLWSFEVNNTEEPPQFDNDNDHSIINPISFGIVAEEVAFNKEFYLVDEDIAFGLDSLNLSYSFNSTPPSTFSLTQLNSTYIHINFTPALSDAGVYYLNLSANDSSGFSVTQIVTLTISDNSVFPLIKQIQPYYNASSSSTVEDVLIAIAPTNTSIMVTADENDTYVFDFRAVDNDNLSMNYSWYFDGSLVDSGDYVAGSPNSNYTKTFSFFENGTRNVTVVVEGVGSDSFTWLVNVSNVNRPPVLKNLARNLTGTSAIQASSSVIFTNFFFLYWDENIVFYDPDDDLNANEEIDIDGNETNNLAFAINTSGTCDELATFTFNEFDDNLTVTVINSGTCTTTFTATDEEGEIVSSNPVTIQVIRTQSSSSSSSSSSGTRTVTETVTVPVEEPVDVPEKFAILFPGTSNLYENGSLVIPIKLENTWEEALVGITLSINNTDLNLTYRFDKNYFEQLAVDEVVFTNLTLFDYRRDGPFSFNVTAFVGSLQYTDFETVFVNSLERGQEDLESLKSRIGFARDLLTDNPECGELLSVLEDAENNPDQANFEIINNVINGCKYLIGDRDGRDNALPKSFTGKLSVYGKTIVDYDLLATVLLLLLGVGVITAITVRLTMKNI